MYSTLMYLVYNFADTRSSHGPVMEIWGEAGSEVRQSPQKMPDGGGSAGLLVRVDSPQALELLDRTWHG